MKAPLIVLTLLVLTGGCIDKIPGIQKDLDLDAIPGVGEVPMHDAILTLNLTGCQESHLILDANATQLAPTLPANQIPLTKANDNATLALTIARCTTIQTENTTAYDATLAHIATPLEASEKTTRTDALIALFTNDASLSRDLSALGLPVEGTTTIDVDTATTNDVVTTAHFEVRAPGYTLEATSTAVSIPTELPFQTATSISRTVQATTQNQTLTVQPELNVTHVGGLSATITPQPGTFLHRTLDAHPAPAYGYAVHYDARLGVFAS